MVVGCCECARALANQLPQHQPTLIISKFPVRTCSSTLILPSRQPSRTVCACRMFRRAHARVYLRVHLRVRVRVVCACACACACARACACACACACGAGVGLGRGWGWGWDAYVHMFTWLWWCSRVPSGREPQCQRPSAVRLGLLRHRHVSLFEPAFLVCDAVHSDTLTLDLNTLGRHTHYLCELNFVWVLAQLAWLIGHTGRGRCAVTGSRRWGPSWGQSVTLRPLI